jgi:hypothetical protein
MTLKTRTPSAETPPSRRSVTRHQRLKQSVEFSWKSCAGALHNKLPSKLQVTSHALLNSSTEFVPVLATFIERNACNSAHTVNLHMTPLRISQLRENWRSTPYFSYGNKSIYTHTFHLSQWTDWSTQYLWFSLQVAAGKSASHLRA